MLKKSNDDFIKGSNNGDFQKNTIINFIPKGGEEDIIDQCKDGQPLNLWPRTVSYRYHVYRPGNPDVGGKVSTVPDKYTEAISIAKEENRLIKAEIYVINGKKKVKIELYSKNASDSERGEQTTIFAERLSKKYRPQKPIVCKIFLCIDHGLSPGDSIFLRDKPIEYYVTIAASGGVTLFFYDTNGRDIGRLEYPAGVQERILRAKYSGYVLDAKILDIKDQSPYVTEIVGHIEASMEIKFIKRC